MTVSVEGHVACGRVAQILMEQVEAQASEIARLREALPKAFAEGFANGCDATLGVGGSPEWEDSQTFASLKTGGQ